MTFEAMLIAAKLGNTKAHSALIELYFPLIAKSSFSNSKYDEDLEQEFIELLMKCVRSFDPDKYL